jgi:hypothetical protein
MDDAPINDFAYTERHVRELLIERNCKNHFSRGGSIWLQEVIL